MRIGFGILAVVLALVLVTATSRDGWAAPTAPGGSIACARPRSHPTSLIEDALDPLAEHRLRERVLRLGLERTRLDSGRAVPHHGFRLESTGRTAPTRRLVRPPRVASAPSSSPSSH